MAEEKVLNIEDLQQDDKNFNAGTEEGQRMMEKSFSELGAGRSILIDKNGKIIAGNKSQQAAIAAGIKKVRVIETTGDELVAVKRTDVDLDSVEGRKLALADNATQVVNLAWDEVQLEGVRDELEGFNPGEWGVELPDFDPEPKEKKEPQTKELRPFATNHILLSYPIDLHDRVMQAVEQLRELEGMEIETSAN
jgi:hypothetical protein